MKVRLFIGKYLKNKGVFFEDKPNELSISVKDNNGNTIGEVSETFMEFPHILYCKKKDDVYITATGNNFYEIEKELYGKIKDIDNIIEELKHVAKSIRIIYKELIENNKGGEQ